MDGRAGVQKAEVADVHEALGEDMPQEPAEHLQAVEVGSAEAWPAHFAVGKGDRALRARAKTAVSDGALEDRGGEGGEGGVAVRIRLTVEVPGDRPDLARAVLQQTGLAHLCFEERTGEGGEGFHRPREVGSGG